MASSFVEANAGGRLAPGLAEVGRNLHGRSPPTALAGEHDDAARRHVGEVVDFTALEYRPAQGPVAPPAVRHRVERTFSWADEQQDLHKVGSYRYQVSAISSAPEFWPHRS